MGESEKWKDVIGGGSVVVVFTSSPHPPPPSPHSPTDLRPRQKIISNESVFLLKLKTDTFTKLMYPKNQQSTNIAPPPSPEFKCVHSILCMLRCYMCFIFCVRCKYVKKTFVNINNSTVIIQCPWQGGPPLHSFNI